MNRKQRLQNITSGYRQSEDGVLEAKSNGLFDVRVNGRDTTYAGLGPTFFDADNAPGETVRLTFLQASPLMPIFFSRGSKPNIGSTDAPEAEVGIILEWTTSLGRLGGQRSIGLHADDTVTLLEAEPEVLAEEYILHIRSDHQHLYWIPDDDLAIHRVDRDGNEESQEFGDLYPYWDGICTMLDEGLFFVSTGQRQGALLQWGEEEPLWILNPSGLPGQLRFWSDVIPYTHPDDGEQLLIPYRVGNMALCGYLRVDRATGEMLANEAMPMGDRPEEVLDLHPKSPTYPRDDARDGSVAIEWKDYWLNVGQDSRVRGVLQAGEVIVPAVVFSDTVVAYDPLDNSLKWRINGGEDFKPAGDEQAFHGDTTKFQRYSVVCCDEKRVILWVCEFEYTYHDNEKIYDVDYSPKLAYLMHDDDIEHCQDNSDSNPWDDTDRGTQIQQASFNDSPVRFYPAINPDPTTYYTTRKSELESEVNEALADPQDPMAAQQLILSGTRYGYRIVDAETGGKISEWWLRDLDGPSIDGARPDPEKHEFVELPTGAADRIGYKSTQLSWDDWSGVPGDFDYKGPTEIMALTEFCESPGEGFILGKTMMELNFSGPSWTPANCADSPSVDRMVHAPYGEEQIDSDWLTPENIKFYNYPIHNFYREMHDETSPDEIYSTQLWGYGYWGFRPLGVTTGPIRMEWLLAYNSVRVHAVSFIHEVHRINFKFDGLPRWDAVSGCLVGDQIVFGPGARNVEHEEMGEI